MSKKYFINNLDTPFGSTLLNQLVKQPIEEPIHMCTVRVPIQQKPNGIKKVLKRQKPKLFRKKAVQQCQVYVYNISNTEITDIDFGIETMSKPFEDNKVFILVSDIMVWAETPRKVKKDPPPPPPEEQENQDAPPPEKKEEAEEGEGEGEEEAEANVEAEEEQKPIQYTFWEEGDFQERVPHPQYAYIKEVEERVLAIKRQNVRVLIVCPGIIYGCGEDTFYDLFKASWLQNPPKMPYLQAGDNLIPTIHLRDLAKFVIKVAQNPPEGQNYLLAIDQTHDRTQKALVQAISSGIGSGRVQNLKESPLMEASERYLLNIDIRGSKQLLGTAEEPVEFEWSARTGIKANIASLLKDFNQKEQLRPMKILLLQGDGQGKQTSLKPIIKTFQEYYRIPVLGVKEMLQSAKEGDNEELVADLREEWANLLEYVAKGEEVKDLNETMKVFYRAVRWRLSQNDCANRGYILLNFPHHNSELNYIFDRVNPKKFKAKPKPKPKAPPKAPSKEVISQQSIEQGGEAQAPPPAEQEPKPEEEEEPKEEEEAVDEEAGEEGAPKYEPYYPESVISVKKMGAFGEHELVVDYFTSRGMEELVYDTAGRTHHEIFESMRSYIQRNGRPNNYLVPEQDLLNRHRDFTLSQDKQSVERRQADKMAKTKAVEQVQAKRRKLAEQMIQLVSNQGEQEIKKMPFRNYLMEFVVPTLNVGLLEVSNIIPNDPVDLLAQFLYQKSYDV